MYEAWTAVKPGERKITSSRRKSILSSFGKYLASNGYPDIYTGNDDRRSFNSDYIPYVFSREEISRMFAMLDESCSKNPGYENDAFRTMMSMYYCCGFRKSEVVMLRLCDIARIRSFSMESCIRTSPSAGPPFIKSTIAS